MQKVIRFIATLLFFSSLYACAPSSVLSSPEIPVTQTLPITNTWVPTSSPSPTSTLAPTSTASPTLTPTQTWTPIPTVTPTPSPTPLGGGAGQIAFASNAGIELLDVSSLSRQPMGIWGSWLAWFSQGNVIAYLHFIGGSSPSHELCTFKLVGGKESCIKLQTAFLTLPFSLSSDQKSIIFGTSSSEGQFLVIVAPANNNQRVIPEGEYPTWSPDGKRIAFTNDGRIYTMNADGSDQSMLIAASGNSNLSWSPRGDRIAFISYKTGNGDVYLTALDGMQTRLSTSSNYDGYIAWSPDGSRLAYISAYDMSYAGLFGDVFVVDLSDNTTRQITTAIGATSASPSWSPDSQWLTFGACKPGQSSASCAIFIVNSDGSGLQQVKEYEPYEARPVWRP